MTIGKYQLKDGRGNNFSNQVLNIQIMILRLDLLPFDLHVEDIIYPL